MQSDGDEGVLVDLAIKAIEMLAAVKPGADKAAADGDSGARLSCGELPMAQATVLCILRVGIIERLSETGQVRCCIVGIGSQGSDTPGCRLFWGSQLGAAVRAALSCTCSLEAPFLFILLPEA